MSRRKISVLIVTLLLVLSMPVNAQKFETSFDVPLDKIWTVKFNKDIDVDSVTKNSIYIESEEGNRINMEYDFKVNGGIKEVKLINKDGLFEPDKRYTIYIKDVLGRNNEKIKKYYSKDFITKSAEVDKNLVYINNQEDRDKYEVGVWGTLLHPFSYDQEKKKYYTYVIRGLYSGFEKGNAIPYDIPEDTIFIKDIDIYYKLAEQDYFKNNEVTIDDLELYQKTEMKFTKEKPYWVEKVLFEEPQDGYDVGFFPVDYPENGLSEEGFGAQQFRYERGGLKNEIIFSGIERHTHIPMKSVYNNELKEIKYYYYIYQNHNFLYDQTTSLETWSSPVHVIGEDGNQIYYNLVNSGDIDKDGGYIYNKENGKSKRITNGWFHFIDEDYIYYTNENIKRVNKNGENKEALYPELERSNFTTTYLEGDNIYSHNRSSPGQIWKLDKNGKGAKVILEYSGLKDGFEVSDGKVYFGLEDGIYEAIGDGSRVRKLVDGNYKVLYLLDDYLYYQKSSLIYNFDKYKIKVK